MKLDVNTPEHDALMEAFEAATKAGGGGGRGGLRRGVRGYWPMGHFYESCEGNQRFLAFRAGYELGRSKGV